MIDSTTPLTMKEIDDFLVRMDKNKCPWCGGNHWGMHIDADAEATTPVQPGLRSIPRIRLEIKENNQMAGSVSIGPDTSLTVAVAECQECGHLSFFNYFTIMKLIRSVKKD